MARRRIKASNLRIGDDVLYFGKVDSMNQLYYNVALQARAWDVVMIDAAGKRINEIIWDSDSMLVDR